ncbi:hypothetical protein [Pseudobacteriovorax antillogorgiicola]|uniref:Uncharacterized protein n=1 Tax=Pseudobacteriovorax antillogorgiicola TaxID=1513793 RepID=A0A1Y6C5Y1_9BACT|nr:hypothetical protein [Pseudobacteriovorax antillogorgiicola]TCS49370.1 hypothetical protein EDD56_11550 [Pseudobacteriovorax antillogorgiicola]SMF47433.1 hypothetical protein SAMN06296036_114134 [Pseudobacteriovorax antillogorgiicola]
MKVICLESKREALVKVDSSTLSNDQTNVKLSTHESLSLHDTLRDVGRDSFLWTI